MNTRIRLARAAACLLLAAAGTHVHAQQAMQDAADPQATVPATRYQSALGTRPEPASRSSPDANWVAGNATVAATNSMALTMKGMERGQHDHAAMMQGMGMDKKDGPAMCKPGAGASASGQGMPCMSGDQAGDGKVSCCPSCCESCCKDRMKKDKESP